MIEHQREGGVDLQQFQYNNSQVLQKVKGHLENTDFIGVTVCYPATSKKLQCHTI